MGGYFSFNSQYTFSKTNINAKILYLKLNNNQDDEQSLIFESTLHLKKKLCNFRLKSNLSKNSKQVNEAVEILIKDKNKADAEHNGGVIEHLDREKTSLNQFKSTLESTDQHISTQQNINIVQRRFSIIHEHANTVIWGHRRYSQNLIFNLERQLTNQIENVEISQSYWSAGLAFAIATCSFIMLGFLIFRGFRSYSSIAQNIPNNLIQNQQQTLLVLDDAISPISTVSVSYLLYRVCKIRK